MRRYEINYSATLLRALQQMDDRKVKFLVAVNEVGHVVGTLSDGDVRRALLSGIGLDVAVSEAIYRRFTSVLNTDGLSQVLEAFKDSRIEFLPVLRADGTMCNLITRRALQVLLLQNESFRMDYPFETLDTNTLEYEIFARPWGFYKTTILNHLFQVKVIHIMPMQQLSLQSHERREEYWIVVDGEGRVQIGESVHLAIPGGTYFIPKGCKHRLSNTSSDKVLIITEVQLGDYFGEDDIKRYEDIYGRKIATKYTSG